MTQGLRWGVALGLGWGAVGAAGPARAAEPAAADVLARMQQVADWQLARPFPKPLACWEQGALYTGLTALADLSADPKYRAALREVGDKTGWQPGPNTYHADDHAVGQLYTACFAAWREPAMLAPLRARFDFILANAATNAIGGIIPRGAMRWWWCDALFMAPPAWAQLGALTGEAKYVDFLVREWRATSAFLYHPDEHLYFRDQTYFKKREANGRPVFWSRGNGWVLGGLVRVLQALPAAHPDRAFFEQQFREMAEAVRACQQPDGLWRSSLLDPEHYPLPEASGSGFFTYALAWGVNQGLLEPARFEPAARRSGAGLGGLVDPDGKLTHVQPVGADPRTFKPESTDVYGVGAFLLAGSELYRLTLLQAKPHAAVTVASALDAFRPQQTVELAWTEVRARLPAARPESVAVLDGVAGRWLTSQVVDEDGDGQPDRLLWQTDLLPRQTKTFTLVADVDRAALPAPTLTTTARFVPERADDFAWESDRIAFRCYGPALWKHEKPGATGSGMDVWCKHGRQPVVDRMYRRGDYHHDNGESVDTYKVGADRGCGGTAVWAQDRLWAGRCYESWKRLAAGPIRAIFELTYGAWDAAGRPVREIKRVSLDLGSNFNRFDCRFLTDDGAAPLTVAAGVTLHRGAAVEQAGDWAAVWEPGDAPANGELGLAVIAPGGAYRQAAGHALLLQPVAPGASVSFYAGAGWSKGPDYPDRAAWTAAVRAWSARLASPLQVQFK